MKLGPYVFKNTELDPAGGEEIVTLASALQVPTAYLMGEVKQPPSDMALDQKLSHIGFSVGYYEDDSIMWINYPDGTLEVSLADLEILNKQANDYLRFLLYDLREKHSKDFRPTPGKGVRHGND